MTVIHLKAGRVWSTKRWRLKFHTRHEDNIERLESMRWFAVYLIRWYVALGFMR